jgi:hypothetical protein
VVDPSGDAAVVWLGYQNPSDQVVRAATRPAGGEWSQPVALSAVGAQAAEPDVSIDPRGDVTAVWDGEVGWEEGMVEAATRPAGGGWSAAVELSDHSATAVSPQVVADAQGNVTALWTLDSPDREDGIVQSRVRPAGGEWSSETVDVSGSEGLATHPRIALDAEGNATAVWQRKDIPAASGFHYFVQAARRIDGTWSAPVTISREDGLAQNPELTVDPDGNATVVWNWSPLATGLPTGLQTRSDHADGSWGDTVFVATRPGGVEPSESDLQVAADPQGNVTVIWTGWAAPSFVVRAARRAADGTWSAPVDLSTGYSFLPRMAVDPRGDVTAVWSGLEGTTQAVRSRVFDSVAPEIRDLAVPATGVVGQPVAMSVDPFDLWSAVATSWDFGDGGSGSGASVSHCYASPGERTVTVTGTDAAENQASATAAITIEPNPALEPRENPCGSSVPPEAPAPAEERRAPDQPGPPRPPLITGLRQSSSRWREPGAPGRSQAPLGTVFRFGLDRAARVRLAFLRVVPGRRHQARGALAVAGAAGANAYRFQGTIHGRTLPAGRYRLRLNARADGLTSASAWISFTIVR